MMNITRPNLYDSDYQLWLENTINQLRRGDFQSVDWQNLLEELADLGKNTVLLPGRFEGFSPRHNNQTTTASTAANGRWTPVPAQRPTCQ